MNTKTKFHFLQQGRSNHRVVRLQKLHLKTSGIFTCEVSSEAPRFSTATGAGTMNVSIVHNKQSAFFPNKLYYYC